MNQLNIFDLPIQAEPETPLFPDPEPKPAMSEHLREWLELKADYQLRLANKLSKSGRFPELVNQILKERQTTMERLKQ